MVKYRCLREPGFTRFLWLSALLHVCTAVGLTIFWEQREGDRHSPLSIPLRVSLIHPEEGPTPLREPGIGAESLTPRAPSKRVKPSIPSARTATRVPAISHLPLPSPPNQLADRQLATNPEMVSPPSTFPQMEPQSPHSGEASVSSSQLTIRGRGIGPLPRISDEDLEKFARLPHPEGRRLDRPLSGVDTAISLNTTEVKYLSYFTHLKQKIDRHWSYPGEAATQGLHGQLLLLFVLHHNGQVNRVELLRSSGSKILDKEAWEAVLNASPFDPFPPQIQQEELHIRARFTYVLEAASQRARVH